MYSGLGLTPANNGTSDMDKKRAAMERRLMIKTQQKSKDNGQDSTQKNELIFSRKMGLGGY